MKTTIKRENNEFLVITLKHVSGLTSHANRPGTRKIWAIAHENGHKTRKLQVFGPNSQTCIGSLKPRKSPRNYENDEFFAYLSNMYRVLRAMQIALEPEKYGQ